jgi:hypothetical protein
MTGSSSNILLLLLLLSEFLQCLELRTDKNRVHFYIGGREQCFRGVCFLHLQGVIGTLKLKSERYCEIPAHIC